ncbi:MmcQ/YjbR family DNA-binding protein [Spiroplasma endosymbiont of Labia minor]|uniref:MmcQ/YjbR family DNA-binding protein n=1 Tax=Spiroplasma endosymbiont of Labia minor TaxID=3066305 RepID=UPI0030D464F1
MKNELKSHEKSPISIPNLISYGFVQAGEQYLYSVDLLDEQFELTVVISQKGELMTSVIEKLTGIEYTLHRISEATGKFVEEIRENYNQVLKDIKDHCFYFEMFQNSITKQVIKYIDEKYQNKPEFLWPKTPHYAIFRHKDNKKWYAAILMVQKQKIGLKGVNKVEIINLRIDFKKILQFIDDKKYFAAFHMNKKNLITIPLDGSVSVLDIFLYIDESFQLTKNKINLF